MGIDIYAKWDGMTETEEQAQIKVEAAQRFPIRLTGMALVNSFYNSRQNGGVGEPAVAAPAPGST